ncbi:sialic acid TRAP transporter substrate-binding protein SiaP [Aurantimonas sp. C2-6-R+9]|uniref:DctP family TRAP transporter solute-binding subunit n=2 Tax=root TaxID=1 RepID=A0A9C9TII6_9HYPH|nr:MULTISPECIES: sialic acid TRAP transporter substrate-binding protein SiaP [unclassified Aurantimonas]MEC5290890.1 sialic acid TRAP transporter substrate-binding protein SiaP [Aurantimonas sp. C2-3-R2]MEC5323968.1 sialic acid TRAP transporter substrate-binding protein SiaP [Aurantimonas sp. A3-2-R12]MEC5381067.1 sialic acid TRAP transporter substrate-binding protein SiaP [Aurantimonas sp. C2-6-R+9]MEC5412040.1 sialic acid TRAP transporter substrate-binding protein SiaP [Aurantimonas sp. C2-4-
MKYLKQCLAMSAAMGVALSAQAAAAETVLKFAHVYEESEPYHTCAVAASDKLKAATEDRYSIEVFPASSLGKEVDINEGLGLGTVDIIYTGQLFAGRAYGPIAIGGAPFMFRDYDHWDKYRNSDLFKELAEGYREASGNHVVATTYYGQRHVTSNKPILKPEDMAGMKIRVPNAPLYMMFPKAVGANPTPIAFAEVYLALQQGTVDGQENPLPTIQAKKFYEVQSNINLTGHINDALLTIVGGPTWDQMDEADQTALTQVLTETADCATAQVREKEAELAAWFEEQGVTVNKVDITPFREATMKLHNGEDATWDQETYDKLQAIK